MNNLWAGTERKKQKKVVEYYAARMLGPRTQTLGMDACSKWPGLLRGFTR